MNTKTRKKLTVTILSLSLLTVMAGAAVAPALNVIKEHFCDVNQTLVQMIISIPALFIALTGFAFPKLSQKFKAKELVLAGLLLYVVGGCAAGLFSNIYIILVFRALVGVGVGIIMPLSTGLLSFYFAPNEQDKLMGYSSAMNQMGGVVATLISGVLANISWRASFLVYMMGFISMVLCLLFLPNDKISGKREEQKSKGIFSEYYVYIIGIFLLMVTFFVYPSVFAIETAKENIIPQRFIAVIMAGMDFIAFLGGLLFVHIKRAMGSITRFVAPTMFLLGYLSLFIVGGWIGAIVGSVFIGFANGLGIPFIISSASQKAGKTAAITVMPLISMAMYLAQFVTPMALSLVSFVSPYAVAGGMAVLFVVWSVRIKTTS